MQQQQQHSSILPVLWRCHGSIAVLPLPLRMTVLGSKGVGELVNIEVEAQTQAIVQTVERVMEQLLEKKGINFMSG
jgi:riboflavin synthase alpha subunit